MTRDAEKVLRVPVGDIASGMTLRVQVTGLQWFRVRMWLGLSLIRVAAWVIGIPMSVDVESDGDA